jgi:hypothetical protein
MKDIDRLKEEIKKLADAETNGDKARGFRYDDAGMVLVMCELLFFGEDGNLLSDDARADRSADDVVAVLSDTVMRYTTAGVAIRNLREKRK